MKKKYVVLSISVLLLGLAVAGGTYAWLTLGLNVVNGNYNIESH